MIQIIKNTESTKIISTFFKYHEKEINIKNFKRILNIFIKYAKYGIYFKNNKELIDSISKELYNVDTSDVFDFAFYFESLFDILEFSRIISSDNKRKFNISKNIFELEDMTISQFLKIYNDNSQLKIFLRKKKLHLLSELS